MTITQYATNRYFTTGHVGHNDGTIMVSLPHIPGVDRAADRAETAPPPSRRPPLPPRRGVSAAQRVAMFRAALIEVMEGEG